MVTIHLAKQCCNKINESYYIFISLLICYSVACYYMLPRAFTDLGVGGGR